MLIKLPTLVVQLNYLNMLKIFITIAAFCFFYTAAAQQVLPNEEPVVITGQLVKITQPLRDISPTDARIPDVKVRDEEGRIWPAGKKPVPFTPAYFANQQQNSDAALQRAYNALNPASASRAITANFDGVGYQPLNPPDPTLCVGTNHVIHMVNGSSGAKFKIYTKTGTQVVAETFMDAITGKGGLGDPIAMYDQLADRYVMTEFNNASETGSEGLTFAISQTGDPTGSWYVYFFSTGTIFPDYPKFSVWPDAYYATTNDFTANYVGSTVYAFDRAKMIVGNTTATMQKFTLGGTNKYFSMCPVLMQGTTLPPAGSGGLIAYMADDAWTSSTADIDSIGLLEFKVNFTTPSLTTVTHKASLAVAAYKSDICTAFRGQCITQPGTTSRLEALHQKIANQPVYRRFGGYEGIVLTHAVDKGSNIAGARWYELRKTTGNWGVYQQATYAPDNTNRFMPSTCYDKYGNIGMAYNVSSSATTVYPGARYTGRKECDALNTMTYSEEVLIAGTTANGSTRYGDYNQLVCDPDGERFWFTCEYNTASTWKTRVSAFTLDPCTVAVCGDPTGLAASAITTSGATVSWAAVSGALNYTVEYKLTTSATWTTAAAAATTTSVSITGLGQNTLYDWRVRANCSGGSGNFVAAQFTTASPATCNTPTGLAASGITASGATVSWSAVSGAANYDVDYKLTTSATWINAVTATTGTSRAITGLAASTAYDWRVRANCTAVGLSSAYAQAQFTTTAVVANCVTAFEPNETQATAATITAGVTNSAAISSTTDNDYFRVVTTATSNNVFSLVGPAGVDYDMTIFNSAGTQIGSGTGSTATETVSLNSQPAGTYFIRVYGYNGANSSTCYTIRATVTPIATGCASTLDNTTNGTIAGAALIPFNTNVTGLISPTGDIDHYRFVITTGGTITLTLGTLPADYDLRLLNSAGTQIAISENGSTTGETISTTLAAGTYYAQVFGYNGANNATTCYTLRVATGTASAPELVSTGKGNKRVEVYPNPAKDIMNISLPGNTGLSEVRVFNSNGKVVLNNRVTGTVSQISIAALPAGIYLVKITNSNREVHVVKLIKE
jgi:Secretion system C-terminal sorting domain/Bacterial pre-peptidase C-terminal domain/Fibronectin type III domain